MKTLLFLIHKEFLQIFRNKMMLQIIFGIPIIQLLILVNAATYEIKNINIGIIDLDQSSLSRRFISKIQGSQYFIVTSFYFSNKEGILAIDNNKIKALLVIPKNFEKDIIFRNTPIKIQLLNDAINSVNASITYAYFQQLFSSFLNEEKYDKTSIQSLKIDIIPKYRYNSDFDYKKYMVPGVLVMLITLISFVLGALNIVREKEVGTIEQINVTPIKKYEFIIGKLFPFWIIALLDFTIGLILGKLFYNIPIVGSIPLLYLVAGVYLIILLSLGLFISTIVDTQQQATLVAFFFLMIFILLSGLFTSLESMPQWILVINKINPLAYFIQTIRMILLKGSNFWDILPNFTAIIILAIISMSLAIFRVRKTQ
ncbi:MAG TPA: ABC transporter permease [Candidatus Kapabacteria bacterium]|nr:ABC transporter permease [Candidatus Kapabacteria bacterium]